MPEASLFGIVLLAAALPFVALADWFRWIKQQPPHEQALARASHGAALIVFVLLATFGTGGVNGVVTFVGQAAADPADEWPGLVLAIVFVWGVVWFVSGVSGARGLRNGLLAWRAFVKLALGLGAILYLERGHPSGALGSNGARMSILLVGLWCVVTGAVKFVLLRMGGSNALAVVTRNMHRRTAPLRAARPGWFWWW